jgi:alpha-aminoadipate/glutamate carrier protein LysW
MVNIDLGMRLGASTSLFASGMGAGKKEEGAMVNCPLCDAVIDVDEDELDEGDSLICEECGANLNVSGVSPLELVSDAADDDEVEDLDEDDLDEDDDEDEDEDEEEDWK